MLVGFHNHSSLLIAAHPQPPPAPSHPTHPRRPREQVFDSTYGSWSHFLATDATMQRMWRTGVPPQHRARAWLLALGRGAQATPAVFELCRQRAAFLLRAQALQASHAKAVARAVQKRASVMVLEPGSTASAAMLRRVSTAAPASTASSSRRASQTPAASAAPASSPPAATTEDGDPAPAAAVVSSQRGGPEEGGGAAAPATPPAPPPPPPTATPGGLATVREGREGGRRSGHAPPPPPLAVLSPAGAFSLPIGSASSRRGSAAVGGGLPSGGGGSFAVVPIGSAGGLGSLSRRASSARHLGGDGGPLGSPAFWLSPAGGSVSGFGLPPPALPIAYHGREESLTLIPTDLPRVFPRLHLFGPEESVAEGPLSSALRDVLEAFAVFRPDIGYVQGLAYLAGMLWVFLGGSSVVAAARRPIGAVDAQLATDPRTSRLPLVQPVTTAPGAAWVHPYPQYMSATVPQPAPPPSARGAAAAGGGGSTASSTAGLREVAFLAPSGATPAGGMHPTSAALMVAGEQGPASTSSLHSTPTGSPRADPAAALTPTWSSMWTRSGAALTSLASLLAVGPRHLFTRRPAGDELLLKLPPPARHASEADRSLRAAAGGGGGLSSPPPHPPASSTAAAVRRATLTPSTSTPGSSAGGSSGGGALGWIFGGLLSSGSPSSTPGTPHAGQASAAAPPPSSPAPLPSPPPPQRIHRQAVAASDTPPTPLLVADDRYLVFQALANLMQRHHLYAFYTMDPGTLAPYYDAFDRLLAATDPLLAAHLAECGIHCEMYLLGWFQTVFTKCLPFGAAARVWDVFLLEGVPFLYRFAIALLSALSMHMGLGGEDGGGSYEDTIYLLTSNPQRAHVWAKVAADPDALMQAAEAVPLPADIALELAELTEDPFFYRRVAGPRSLAASTALLVGAGAGGSRRRGHTGSSLGAAVAAPLQVGGSVVPSGGAGGGGGGVGGGGGEEAGGGMMRGRVGSWASVASAAGGGMVDTVLPAVAGE
jgi:hypothetical protein